MVLVPAINPWRVGNSELVVTRAQPCQENAAAFALAQVEGTVGDNVNVRGAFNNQRRQWRGPRRHPTSVAGSGRNVLAREQSRNGFSRARCSS